MFKTLLGLFLTKHYQSERHADAQMLLVSLRYKAIASTWLSKTTARAFRSLSTHIPDSHLHFGLRHIRQLVIDRGGSFEVFNGDESGLVVKVRPSIWGARHDSGHDHRRS